MASLNRYIGRAQRRAGDALVGYEGPVFRGNAVTGISSSNGQQPLARAIDVVEIRHLSRDGYLV